MTKARRVFFVLLMATAVATAGCSTQPQIDYESAGLVDVSGVVTIDGRPLPDALVVFEMPDTQFSSGRTDQNGRYRLQFDANVAGVTPGPKTVRISTAGAATEEEAATRRVETVPAKYNKNSELKVEVKPGEDQTFDFELESRGNVEQPERETPEK